MLAREVINGSAGWSARNRQSFIKNFAFYLKNTSRDIRKGTCLTLLVSKAGLTVKDRDPKCGILAPTCCVRTPNHATWPNKQAPQTTMKIHVESIFIDILTAFFQRYEGLSWQSFDVLTLTFFTATNRSALKTPFSVFLFFFFGPTSRTSAIDSLFRSA